MCVQGFAEELATELELQGVVCTVSNLSECDPEDTLTQEVL